jgi:ribonuclease BN (tRNA processing enzyme)
VTHFFHESTFLPGRQLRGLRTAAPRILRDVGRTADHLAIEAAVRGALDAGDLRLAATHAIRGYGPQILGYLARVLQGEDAAQEVFSAFCEELWAPTTRWDSFRPMLWAPAPAA